MSRLLFDWLNNDVGLSQKVNSFREDFHDGYMLGEILFRYNQQLNFNEFSNKANPKAKLNNFCLLEPTMKRISVHFNSKVVKDIMAGKESTIKNLLYEMKTALESVYRINRQTTSEMLRGTASDKAMCVIHPARDAYEKTISATFSKAIHAQMENTNDVLMADAVKRHTDREASYIATMSTAESDVYETYMDNKLREKELNRTKKAQADEFARSFEAQNITQWKVNQRVAHNRRQLKLKVDGDVAANRATLRANHLQSVRTDTRVGIDDFNGRLDASILAAGTNKDATMDELIKTTTNVPGDRSLALMYIDRDAQRVGYEAAHKKMKEHHEDILVRQQAHDQRRRKFLREYYTVQNKMSMKVFSTEVIAQLLNFARSEKFESEAMDKVVNYKQIIPENRRNREALIGRMEEADAAHATVWDEEEAQREVHWVIAGSREAHVHRSQLLQASVLAAERHISTDVASEVLDKILDVVDWVVSCRKVGVFYYSVPSAEAAHAQSIDAKEAVAAYEAQEAAAAGGKGGDKGGKKDKGGKQEDGAAAGGAVPVIPPVPRSLAHEEGAVVPQDIWLDAVKMFSADSPVALGLQLPEPLVVTDVLFPFSISERPAVSEMQWLFERTFQGEHLLTLDGPSAVIPATATATTAAATAAAQEEGEAGGVAGEEAAAGGEGGGEVAAAAAADTAVVAAAVKEGEEAAAAAASADVDAALSMGEEEPPTAPPVVLSVILAQKDTSDFIEALNTAEVPGAERPTTAAEADAPPAADGKVAGEEEEGTVDVVATTTTAAVAPNASTAGGKESAIPPEEKEGEQQQQVPEEEEEALAAAVVADTRDTLFTPPWLLDAHPRHFLGEALVAVRCAVDPVPDEPAALVDTAHIPLRLALCGVSDVAREAVAAALRQQIPGLRVIQVSTVIQTAFDFYARQHRSATATPVAAQGAALHGVDEGDDLNDEGPVVVVRDANDVEMGLGDSETRFVSTRTQDTAYTAGMDDSSYPNNIGSGTSSAGASQVMNAEEGPASTNDLDGGMASVTGSVADGIGSPACTAGGGGGGEEEEEDALAAEYKLLARGVYGCLIAGAVIPDALYVSLIVHEIKQIPVRNNGFVLQDFPSTKHQLLMLTAALSGISYDAHRPQPLDKVSVYAPAIPAQPWTYDVRKCGLDAVLHVDNGAGIQTTFEQRARARTCAAAAAVATAKDGSDTAASSSPEAIVDGAVEQDVGGGRDDQAVADPEVLMEETAAAAAAGGGGETIVDSAGEAKEIPPSAAAAAAAASVVYLSDDQKSIKGLEVIDDPARPFLASGIDLTVADRHAQDVVQFCSSIQLLDSLVIAEFATVEDAAAKKAAELCEKFIPSENLLPGYLPEPEPEAALPLETAPSIVGAEEELEAAVAQEEGAAEAAVVEEGAAEDPAPIGDGEAEEGIANPDSASDPAPEDVPPVAEEPTPAADAIAADSGNGDGGEAGIAEGEGKEEEQGGGEEAAVVKEKYIYDTPPRIFQANAIPVTLASALLEMWDASEAQSGRKLNAFFRCFRDIRYQVMQRRRVAFDSLSCLLVRLDSRQDLFDEFRIKFNSIHPNMRFDPDSVAELRLQTLELCDALVKLTEQRKYNGIMYSTQVAADTVVQVLEHRCYCEAMALAQSELQRFYVALHVIFDYAKAVRGYPMPIKVLNELEETLPVTLPPEAPDAGDGGKGGKKDAKGGKKADKNAIPGPEPFREPIAPVHLSREVLEAVPDVNGGEGSGADAGKKGGGKKTPKTPKAPKNEGEGESGASSSPFHEIEAPLLQEAAKWQRGTFVANRQVYEEDEPLCLAIEQAVWYEAEKFLHSIGKIKEMAEGQAHWIARAEEEMNVILTDMVSRRYTKELSAVNELINSIESSINEAKPVEDLWLVSPDTCPINPGNIWQDYECYLPPALRTGVWEAPETPPEEGEGGEGGGGGGMRGSASDSLFTRHTAGGSGSGGAGARRDFMRKVKKAGAQDRPHSSGNSFGSGSGDTGDGGGLHLAHPDKAGAAEGAHKKGLQRGNSVGVKESERTSHLNSRRNNTSYYMGGAAGASVDEQFKKEMAIFNSKRVKFEEKLLKKRAEREKEFKAMGMSPATAKLAAYNELVLDEQHMMQDFTAKNKPKRRLPHGAAGKRSQASYRNSRRDGNGGAASRRSLRPQGTVRSNSGGDTPKSGIATPNSTPVSSDP